jgi:hypothetical protein
MAWLDADEPGTPAGLAQWAAAFPRSAEARAACDRADWLFWLLSSAADSERLQRLVVSSGVAAVEFSPGLRRRAAGVAAAHIWSAPTPADRPPRSFQRPLLLAAGVAAVAVALADLVVTSNVAAFRRQPSGPWLRSGTLLAVWCALIIALQPWFERIAARRLASEADRMSFTTARARVVATLAHRPRDPHALEKLRAVDTRWFRSTGA